MFKKILLLALFSSTAAADIENKVWISSEHGVLTSQYGDGIEDANVLINGVKIGVVSDGDPLVDYLGEVQGSSYYIIAGMASYRGCMDRTVVVRVSDNGFEFSPLIEVCSGYKSAHITDDKGSIIINMILSDDVYKVNLNDLNAKVEGYPDYEPSSYFYDK